MFSKSTRPGGQSRPVLDLKNEKWISQSEDLAIEKRNLLQSKILKLVDSQEDGVVFVEGKECRPGDYDVKFLEKGGFSDFVHHYTHKVDPSFSFVVKQVKPGLFRKNEVINLSHCDHKNICQFYGLIRESDKYQIFFEYCGDDVGKLMQEGRHILQYDLFEQLLMCVEHMHSKKIFHLDIKRENICIESSGQVKLIDMGSSIKEDSSDEIQSATSCYASPEMLYYCLQKNLSAENYTKQERTELENLASSYRVTYRSIEKISKKSDNFSLGLTMYHIVYQIPLFGEQQYVLEMYAENINAAIERLPHKDDVLTVIMKGFLEGDSDTRMSITEALDLLRRQRPISQDSEQIQPSQEESGSNSENLMDSPQIHQSQEESGSNLETLMDSEQIQQSQEESGSNSENLMDSQHFFYFQPTEELGFGNLMDSPQIHQSQEESGSNSETLMDSEQIQPSQEESGSNSENLMDFQPAEELGLANSMEKYLNSPDSAPSWFTPLINWPACPEANSDFKNNNGQ